MDAVCSLRPQFHHLDAITDNEKVSGRGGGGDHGPQESEARAVNMAVKSTDDEELDMGEVGKTLRTIQEESWQHLDWVDEEVWSPYVSLPQVFDGEQDERAYATFDNDLQLYSDGARAHRLLSSLTEKQYQEVASAPRVEPMKQGKSVLSTHSWWTSEDEVEEKTVDDEIKPDPQSGKRSRKGRPVQPKVEVS